VEQCFLVLMGNLPGFEHVLSAFQDKISDGKCFAHRRRNVPNKEAGFVFGFEQELSQHPQFARKDGVAGVSATQNAKSDFQQRKSHRRVRWRGGVAENRFIPLVVLPIQTLSPRLSLVSSGRSENQR
jgi:hypothetical protein